MKVKRRSLTGSIDIRRESAPEEVEHEQLEFSDVN